MSRMKALVMAVALAALARAQSCPVPAVATTGNWHYDANAARALFDAARACGQALPPPLRMQLELQLARAQQGADGPAAAAFTAASQRDAATAYALAQAAPPSADPAIARQVAALAFALPAPKDKAAAVAHGATPPQPVFIVPADEPKLLTAAQCNLPVMEPAPGIEYVNFACQATFSGNELAIHSLLLQVAASDNDPDRQCALELQVLQSMGDRHSRSEGVQLFEVELYAGGLQEGIKTRTLGLRVLDALLARANRQAAEFNRRYQNATPTGQAAMLFEALKLGSTSVWREGDFSIFRAYQLAAFAPLVALGYLAQAPASLRPWLMVVVGDALIPRPGLA